jgi:uncharacterized membrane-anchored protein
MRRALKGAGNRTTDFTDDTDQIASTGLLVLVVTHF